MVYVNKDIGHAETRYSKYYMPGIGSYTLTQAEQYCLTLDGSYKLAMAGDEDEMTAIMEAFKEFQLEEMRIDGTTNNNADSGFIQYSDYIPGKTGPLSLFLIYLFVICFLLLNIDFCCISFLLLHKDFSVKIMQCI